MRLSLYRDTLTPQSTTGKLYLEGNFNCFVLELPLRDGLPGSAIPAGVYPIELQPSPRFLSLAQTDPWVAKYASRMPHVCDIPGRSLIMIHWGNFAPDTEGCLVVGKSRLPNFVGSSREAFQQLYPLIEVACQSPDGCLIEVHDPPAQPATDPTDSAWPNS